ANRLRQNYTSFKDVSVFGFWRPFFVPFSLTRLTAHAIAPGRWPDISGRVNFKHDQRITAKTTA
ncbi:MAG: hypothetical protein PVI71_17840, partial [Desulfobacterales bacterium]